MMWTCRTQYFFSTQILIPLDNRNPYYLTQLQNKIQEWIVKVQNRFFFFFCCETSLFCLLSSLSELSLCKAFTLFFEWICNHRAGPSQPLPELLALWIHPDNLALSKDVTCLTCLHHFVLCSLLLQDCRKN